MRYIFIVNCIRVAILQKLYVDKLYNGFRINQKYAMSLTLLLQKVSIRYLLNAREEVELIKMYILRSSSLQITLGIVVSVLLSVLLMKAKQIQIIKQKQN